MLLRQFTTFIRQCCSFILQWAWLSPVIQSYPPLIYALTPVYDFHPPVLLFYPPVGLASASNSILSDSYLCSYASLRLSSASVLLSASSGLAFASNSILSATYLCSYAVNSTYSPVIFSCKYKKTQCIVLLCNDTLR